MNKFKIALVVGIFIVSLILKLHNYHNYPQRGASSDEYTYAFLGISLIKQHIPISWSAFPAYKNISHLTIRKLYFPIVWPYFDHPPLNGLLVGGWSILFGQDTFEKVDLKTIRLIPIMLSIISALFIFLLGYRLYDYKTAVWTLLIYTTTTIFVMNGRVVFAENLLTTLLILTLYLFHLFRKKLTFVKTAMIATLCGLSFWTKEAGITVFFTMLYFFISERIKRRLLTTFIGVSLLIILSYIGYGMYYDGDLFWQILSLQSERDIGPKTLLYITSTPIIVNKVYFDGWYFFGLTSFFLSFLEFKKHRLLLVPATTYFLFLIFSLTQNGEMGWYMIPMFPFMAILSARLLVESLQKQGWYIFVLFLFVGLAQVTFLYQDNFGLIPLQFRVLMIILFGPFILLQLLRKESAVRILGNFWFYIFILGNIIITYTYIHPA